MTCHLYELLPNYDMQQQERRQKNFQGVPTKIQKNKNSIIKAEEGNGKKTDK